jgi:hypothetical protein
MHGGNGRRVRRKRTNGIYPFLPGGVYGGSDDIFFLHAEKTTLTAMGVQGKNRQAGIPLEIPVHIPMDDPDGG